MIALLKVYETSYQNDEHEILYLLIIKSKFSDHFLKSVLFPYSVRREKRGLAKTETEKTTEIRSKPKVNGF